MDLYKLNNSDKKNLHIEANGESDGYFPHYQKSGKNWILVGGEEPEEFLDLKPEELQAILTFLHKFGHVATVGI
jgi:hypothetical protein